MKWFSREMQKKQRWQRLVRFIILLTLVLWVFTRSLQASDIELHFCEVVLVNQGAVALPANPVKRVQGDYEILIRGSDTMKGLRINFGAFNQADYATMAANLELQYRVIHPNENPGAWSEWISLRQLPVLIDLLGQETAINGNFYEIATSQIIVYLRFRFPQTINIPCGVYLGEMQLEVLWNNL